MKNFSTVAALAAALAISTSAFAAQITVDTGSSLSAAGSSSASGGLSGSATAGASTAIGSGVPNTGGVAPSSANSSTQMAVMTFGTTDTELAAVKALGASSQVRVVSVNGNGTDGAALMKAGTDMKADVTKLQNAINANATFKTELAAKNIDVSKIMAAEVAADGSLVLYTTG